MTQVQLAVKLDHLIQTGTNIFLKINPEIIDFTQNDFCFNLIFISKTLEVAIEVNNENFMEVLALVKTALFENSKLFIICWNIKNLFTYKLFKTGCHLEVENKILDLKIAEAFIGVRGKSPSSFDEVVKRLKLVLAGSSWDKFKNIYQKIYSPLMMEVLPKIETEGVFNTEERRILFPYYEIEGQSGGRLSCNLAYDNCFNPHSLSDDLRSKLQPKGNCLSFLCFDYHFHEVCILAWLSKDKLLLELVSGEGDFYRKLYVKLTGNECDSDIKRAFCKDCLFLPVVYGQSARTLAERAKIGIIVAEKLIGKLLDIFPQLFKWIESYESNNGVYCDYIGRKREFMEDEEYKYRNFIVQSPGAIFCLEKLVALYNALGSYGNIVASIHDGYIVRCSESQFEIVRGMCIKVLEGDSNLFPGLNIGVSCKISKTLS